MFFASLIALTSVVLAGASPAKRTDNREWINLLSDCGYEGHELCVGLPPIASDSYLGGALCGTGNSTISDLTKIIALHGVGRSGPLEITKYGCPTSTGADLTGASNVPVVDCDVEDKNQFWTIHGNGQVTNDATGTCLTFGRRAPSAPLTLNTCEPEGELAEAQRFHYQHVSA